MRRRGGGPQVISVHFPLAGCGKPSKAVCKDSDSSILKSDIAYLNFARLTAITLIAATGISKYPAMAQPIDSAIVPNNMGPMNIPRFCPKANTDIPNPANCRDAITSDTAANVAGTVVPEIMPNPIISAGIIHPVTIKGNKHISAITIDELTIKSFRIPRRSER